MQHDVATHELEGGAKLLTIHIPNTISFYWGSYLRGGFLYAPKELYELPHLLEHLAFEGTKSYPEPYDFKSEVEKNGAYYNAHTSSDFVWYDFVGNPDELKRVIDLNFGQMYEPILDTTRIAQQQKVITQEWGRNKENDARRAGYYHALTIQPTAFPDFDERIATVQRVTQSDLQDFHRTHYGASNTVFIASGDLPPAKIDDLTSHLNTKLKGISGGKKYDFKSVPFGKYAGSVKAFEPHTTNQSHFVMGFARQERVDQATAAVLRVIAVMCTGGMGGRLMLKAREAGLTYGISAGMSRDNDSTLFYVSSQTQVDSLMPLVQLAATELEAIAADDYGDHELERAIGYIVGSVRRNYQTPAHYAGWYSSDFIRGRVLDTPEDWVAHIQAVDRQKIKDASKQFLNMNSALLTLVGQGLKGRENEFQGVLKGHFA